MKTLKLTPDAADKAFESADENGKKLLISLYPEHQFLKDIVDRVKTFADVCNETGRDIKKYQITDDMDCDEKAAVYFRMWLLIVFCFNGCEDADWTNKNQYKYYPWMKPPVSSGGVWSCGDYGYWHSGSYPGARLAFLNSAHPEHCVKQFNEIFLGFFQ